MSVDFASTVVIAYAIMHNLCKRQPERYMDEEGKKSKKSEMTVMVMGSKLNPVLSSLGTT